LIKLSIDGMSCENCVRHVCEALEGMSGVVQVSVDLEKGEAEVEATVELLADEIKEVLDEEGYELKNLVQT
tara:strand:- start:584 stop:796 length:213 start_codon:yes stop_codon:yes gene_type:complete